MLWQGTGRQATQTKVPWEGVAQQEEDTSEHIECKLSMLSASIAEAKLHLQGATDGSNNIPCRAVGCKARRAPYWMHVRRSSRTQGKPRLPRCCWL